MAAFSRYIGIDYSGAETPNASLKGLRVYLAVKDAPAVEVWPPPSPRKYWTRRGIGEWLVERLAESDRTLVGIDHGFSFPHGLGHSQAESFFKRLLSTMPAPRCRALIVTWASGGS